MAGALVRMSVQSEGARRSLSALVSRGQSLHEPFEEIGASLVTSTQQRIQDEEDPSGEAWPELALSTQLRRRTKGGRDAKGRYAGKAGEARGGEHILRDRGFLFASLTHVASNADLRVGANRVYAALHQLGGTDDMAPGPASVPARPFLGVSDADEREIESILTDYLAGAVT